MTPDRETIEKIICNPIYTGIGPYPAVITDEQWIGGDYR